MALSPKPANAVFEIHVSGRPSPLRTNDLRHAQYLARSFAEMGSDAHIRDSVTGEVIEWYLAKTA
jgi:hypothetical protein